MCACRASSVNDREMRVVTGDATGLIKGVPLLPILTFTITNFVCVGGGAQSSRSTSLL